MLPQPTIQLCTWSGTWWRAWKPNGFHKCAFKVFEILSATFERRCRPYLRCVIVEKTFRNFLYFWCRREFCYSKNSIRDVTKNIRLDYLSVRSSSILKRVMTWTWIPNMLKPLSFVWGQYLHILNHMWHIHFCFVHNATVVDRWEIVVDVWMSHFTFFDRTAMQFIQSSRFFAHKHNINRLNI